MTALMEAGRSETRSFFPMNAVEVSEPESGPVAYRTAGTKILFLTVDGPLA